MTVVSPIIAKARIVNYDSRIVMYSFIILATVIMIVNYNRTVILIVNYDRKTFIVQATVIFDGFVETKNGRNGSRSLVLPISRKRKRKMTK
jgi:hypothetical protein